MDNVGQAPISALARKMRGSGYNGRRLVRELLRKATDSGLNVMRTFAHTTDPNYPMQIRPGQYDEDVFRALDFVIAEAGRSGVKVILSLVDNWKYAGGVDEFVDWSAGVPPRDPKFPPINKLGDVTLDVSVCACVLGCACAGAWGEEGLLQAHTCGCMRVCAQVPTSVANH